jgi:hypothetical protein
MKRMILLAVGLVAGLMVMGALPASAQAVGPVNEKAIADVVSGKLKVAKASWWGFDPADSTMCLQAAINSKVPKLIVDNLGKPWITLPLFLVSNQEIEFEKGVELLAKRGAYIATNDALITGTLVDNITLRGYGATMRMWRDDYDKEPYKHAEWRHVINLHSCSNIKILGLSLVESGGDGIYLGTGKSGVTNKNILIRDVVCDKNYRQGISVITAENLLIENTILSNTDGTAPRAGIDFEPNGPNERLVNCVMRNCKSRGNAGCGYVAYIPTLNATSAPVGLTLENCDARDNGGPAAAFMTGNTPAAAVTGKLELINCTLEGPKQPGFMLTSNPPSGLRVLLKNVSIVDTAIDTPLQSPIVFMSDPGATQDVGGVKFVDCLIRDPLDRKPMVFADASGSVRLSDVTGNFILEKNGVKTPITITDKVLADWMPSLKLKRLPHLKIADLAFAPVTPQADPKKYAAPFARQRDTANFVLYAKAGDTVNLKLFHGQVGKYSGKTNQLVVSDWSGKEIGKFDFAFMKDTDVSFKAPTTGLYRLTSACSPNYLQISASSHPVNLSGEGAPIHLFSQSGTFYFYVPANTAEFAVKLYGQGLGEGVKAALYKPNGELFGEQDNIAQAFQFEVASPQPKGEIWSLKLSRASQVFLEDNYVDLFGIPAFLAPSPEAVLAPIK